MESEKMGRVLRCLVSSGVKNFLLDKHVLNTNIISNDSITSVASTPMKYEFFSKDPLSFSRPLIYYSQELAFGCFLFSKEIRRNVRCCKVDLGDK